jgi:methylglyoxal synthase
MLNHEDWRPRRWRVALMAHDSKKAVLTAFVLRHRAAFAGWALLATGGTGAAVREATGLKLRPLLPGPQGGDAQVGAEIATGEIDALIFLRDPRSGPPHEPDPATLLRLADLHNVATATNLASAECLVRALAPETGPHIPEHSSPTSPASSPA